jgi:uncharacterized glyoxalase superfamily protein PhnB
VAAKLASALPYLLVRDVDAAAAHYRDAFGFAELGGVGSLAIVGRDQVVLMLRQAERPEQVRSNRGSTGNPLDIDAYIWTDDVHALHDELAGRGARIVDGPARKAYGAIEIEVEDADGHVLCFAENER